MADLENSINPTNTPETVNPTPVSGNNTGIDLSSALEPSTTPSAEVITPVSSIPTQIDNVATVAPQATANIPSNVVANPSLESSKPNQSIDANKAKLMEALKTEWEKGKKAGFARGMLSGMLITLLIAAAGIIFAKDQVIDILSDERLDFLNLKASIVSLTDSQNTNSNTNISNEEAVVEEVTPEESVVEEEVTPEEAAIEEEVATEEAVVEEKVATEEAVSEEEVATEEAVSEEEVATEEAVLEEEVATEKAVLEEEVATEEAVVEEEVTSDKGYTFRHVDSPEEANWVLSPNCEDALCGNDKDSIVMCNEFRLHEGLSDDAKRTGNSGICRYKDTSELVFIEFSDIHNNADTQADSSELTVAITTTPNTNTWGKEIMFEATVNNPGEIVHYERDFGDGSQIDSTRLIAASHVYSMAGVYTVTLTVYDKDGNNYTTTDSVTILELETDEPITE